MLYDLSIFTLFASLVVVTAFYGTTSNWKLYPAGRRLMTLLGVMTALMTYSAVLRFLQIEDRDFFASLFVFALSGAVLWMGWTMHREWRIGRAEADLNTPPKGNTR